MRRFLIFCLIAFVVVFVVAKVFYIPPQTETQVQSQAQAESQLPSQPEKAAAEAEKTSAEAEKVELVESFVPVVAENHPLYFGNPTAAASDVNQKFNYLLEKPQFSISYNDGTLCPNWVAWHLSSSDVGDAGRANNFHADDSLPEGWYAVSKADYKFNLYGFDRGHICPSADRTSSIEDNKATFVMTNMVPQAPDCNRITWMHLESFERELAESGKELYIFAGTTGSGGTGSRGYFTQIPVAEGIAINVPAYMWKILFVLDTGDDDFARVADGNASAFFYAFCMPNAQGCQNDGDFEFYQCSVDYIEEITGWNFFDLLPDELEEELESAVVKISG